jgi:hypothetical protein
MSVLIAVFALIYMMGFIWVAQEARTYLTNFTALSQDEELPDVSVDEGVECCICYEGVVEGCICYEGVVEGKMLSCGHIYHKECIDAWFKEKKICPYCRASPDDCRHKVDDCRHKVDDCQHKVDDCRAQAR